MARKDSGGLTLDAVSLSTPVYGAKGGIRRAIKTPIFATHFNKKRPSEISQNGLGSARLKTATSGAGRRRSSGRSSGSITSTGSTNMASRDLGEMKDGQGEDTRSERLKRLSINVGGGGGGEGGAGPVTDNYDDNLSEDLSGIDGSSRSMAAYAKTGGGFSSSLLELVPEERISMDGSSRSGHAHSAATGMTGLSESLPSDGQLEASLRVGGGGGGGVDGNHFTAFKMNIMTRTQQSNTTLYTTTEKRHMAEFRWMAVLMVPVRESCCYRICFAANRCAKVRTRVGRGHLPGEKQRELESEYFRAIMPKGLRLIRWLMAAMPIFIAIGVGVRWVSVECCSSPYYNGTHTTKWRDVCSRRNHTVAQCVRRDEYQMTAYAIICLAIWAPFNLGFLAFTYTPFFGRTDKKYLALHTMGYVLFAGINLLCDLGGKLFGGDPGFGTTSMLFIAYVMLPTMYPLYLVRSGINIDLRIFDSPDRPACGVVSVYVVCGWWYGGGGLWLLQDSAPNSVTRDLCFSRSPILPFSHYVNNSESSSWSACPVYSSSSLDPLSS